MQRASAPATGISPGAQQRDRLPAGDRAGRDGGESRGQVRRRREDRARDVLGRIPFDSTRMRTSSDVRSAISPASSLATVVAPRTPRSISRELYPAARMSTFSASTPGAPRRAPSSRTRRGGSSRRRAGSGANLRTHGELEVEKVLHALVEKTEGEAGKSGGRARARHRGRGPAGRPGRPASDPPRIGFRERVVVTNDARVAFVAGSPRPRRAGDRVRDRVDRLGPQRGGGDRARGRLGLARRRRGVRFLDRRARDPRRAARRRRTRAGDLARRGSPRALRSRPDGRARPARLRPGVPAAGGRPLRRPGRRRGRAPATAWRQASSRTPPQSSSSPPGASSRGSASGAGPYDVVLSGGTLPRAAGSREAVVRREVASPGARSSGSRSSRPSAPCALALEALAATPMSFPMRR